MDVVIAVERPFNFQYNEASMATTGMEPQPTLPSLHYLFTPAEGMKSTLSKGCKKCQLRTPPSLSLSRSLGSVQVALLACHLCYSIAKAFMM